MYDSKSRAKPRRGRSAVLHRQSFLWAPLARKALNVAIIRSDGLIAKDENEKAAELASFWGKTFEEKLIDTVDVKAFLNEFAADFNFQKLRPPDQNVIEGFLAHARHSAPGPDGLPYGAWRATGRAGSRVLFRVQSQMMEGTHPPNEFNDGSALLARRAASDNRPLSCKNTDNKTLAGGCQSHYDAANCEAR